MKYLILTIAIFVSFNAFSEVDITRPLMILVDENGVEIPNVSRSTSEVEAMEKASRLPDGIYYLVRPDATIVVNNIAVTLPEPDPEIPPIPVDPPTSGSRCTVNANPSNYLSTPGDLCLESGLYVGALDVAPGISIVSEFIGGAEFVGGDEPWSAVLSMNGESSTVDGIKVHSPNNSTSDACEINGTNNTLINTSCSHGGSHKHKIPLKVTGSGHFIGNSWFYGEGRYVVQCFGGNNITFKDNVARWDSTAPNEPTEPNATFSNYSCIDMVWQGNLSIDYGKPETYMEHLGDFAMSSTTEQENLRVQYLGNIVVNHNPDTGNNVAFRADQKARTASNDILLKNWYIKDVGKGFMIKPQYENVRIENCTAINTPLNSDECDGSAVVNFDYINQDLIKRDMCADGERQSDWCLTDLTLSEYLTN